ncbi:alpha/beta hydrolase fold-domain-containing protein [Cercophora newfieldiana]|uniref:Alpha/beta hydrolase fold-domain-containing protein n=1 Tax=Cercophora newfieldiana TaxID=92897 RepID=A0AA39XWZ1_9PEZI|nr:alpha/beta hydrolase fold-domain-containing protein [Cercophora newfieldiana]
METDNLGLFTTMIYKLPVIARAAVLHMLRFTEQSKYVDMRTEIIIAILRSFMWGKPMSVSASQRWLIQETEPKGRIWISNYTCPAPADRGIQDAIAAAIEGLWDGKTEKRMELRMPEMEGVQAEWTGYRAEATPESRLPDVSEKERYDSMMKGVTSPTTIVYFHGGAFWLMDPATHRGTTKRLAKITGGRCYSVRYRLAPQNAFPAAVMDALMSYLGLLYPPPGAFHEAVPAENIVFAGDSAGGNLALALLQTLLQLQRSNTPVFWQGENRAVPLPAGVAVNSPWVDITHSSPSCESNASFDYLPPLSMQLNQEPKRPKCSVWPVDPPRALMYADDDMVMHPLVSLLLAPSWAGAPPIWLCTGRELLSDEDKFMANKFYKDGVRVVYEEYEGMPHCFALLFEKLAEARRCMEGWAGFAKGVVEGGKVKERFTMVKAKTLEEVEVDPETLGPYSVQEIRERVESRMKVGVDAGGAMEAEAVAAKL